MYFMVWIFRRFKKYENLAIHSIGVFFYDYKIILIKSNKSYNWRAHVSMQTNFSLFFIFLPKYEKDKFGNIYFWLPQSTPKILPSIHCLRVSVKTASLFLHVGNTRLFHLPSPSQSRLRPVSFYGWTLLFI